MRDILLTHAERYPLMEPADAVKLIYQNEFGGGHLVRDEAAFFAYLRREYAALEGPGDIAREDIGNGLCRVYLNTLTPTELEALGQAFLRSARRHRGSRERFGQKLEILRQLCREGCFAFSRGELEDYLDRYEAAGYPMVSHSDTYRRAYRPAYRIVLWSELE